MKDSRKVLLGALAGTPLVLLLFAVILAGDVVGEPLQLTATLALVALIIALVVWVVG